MVASRHIFWFLLAVQGLFVLQGCGSNDEAGADAASKATTTEAAVATTAEPAAPVPTPAPTGPTPAPTPYPTMASDECLNEYVAVMEAFGLGCFAGASDGPPDCSLECTMLNVWDESCPDETFDGLGLTNCDCGDNCPEEDNAPCPAEYESPTTKESVRGNFQEMCNPCFKNYQAIGATCGDANADTCAAFATFLAECSEEDFEKMGMTNCDCGDNCPTEDNAPCPSEYETQVTYAMFPDMVAGCNDGTAC